MTSHRGFGSLALQKLAKEAFRRTLISPGLNKEVEHISVLVDRPPEILSLTVDRDEDFVQMSPIRPCRRFSVRGYLGPNFRHHCRTVSYEAMIPR